jgi:putative endonuclease
MTWYLYLLRCGDGSLYCGIARDVAARLAAHRAGKGARYTRGRGPLTLLVKRRCKDKSQALRLELFVKKLPRKEKLALAGSPRRLAPLARAALSPR